MKKFIIAASLLLSFTASSQNMMNIDSVRIYPANPTATDSVWLHIWWWSGWFTSPNPPSVVHSGNNHTVTCCYTVGLMTVVTSGHDSVFIFQGPAGIHNVSWSVYQNATGNSQCDLFLQGNQQQINVLSVGMSENSESALIQLVKDELVLNSTGTLSIYSGEGKLILESYVRPGQRISVAQLSKQLYVAAFRKENGAITTLKFLVN